LKTWVSEQLEAYATIASVEEELAKLKASIDTTIQTDVDSLKQGIGAVSEQIAEVSANLDSAKVELKAAYTEAIETAIEKEHGVITTEIAAAIKETKEAIAVDIEKLENKIILLRDRIKDLEDKVNAIAARIRSVVVVPQYSDGSVFIERNVDNVLKFKVLPLTAAQKAVELGKDAFSIDFVETESRLAQNLTIKEVAFNEADGVVEVTIDPANLPNAFFTGKQEVSVSLSIKDAAATEIASEYFPLVTLIVEPYITFSCSGTQTFTLSYSSTPGTPDLQYSTDAATWNNFSTGDDIVFTDKLYLRGTMTNGTAEDFGDYYSINFDNNGPLVKCEGDIRALVNYNDPAMVTGENVRFCGLFEGCKALETAPSLPAKTLADYCYYSMFSGCINLTEAPILPASTLAEKCYYEMFEDCNKLNNVTMLAATGFDASECLNGWLEGAGTDASVAKRTLKLYDVGSYRAIENSLPDYWKYEDPDFKLELEKTFSTGIGEEGNGIKVPQGSFVTE
ncbi:MAG: hypothetical protein Q4B58_08100, partial [Bacteroidales bacterium]|nr:hypothetical protein [Bacteroidales bacterium]